MEAVGKVTWHCGTESGCCSMHPLGLWSWKGSVVQVGQKHKRKNGKLPGSCCQHQGQFQGCFSSSNNPLCCEVVAGFINLMGSLEL